MPFDFKFDWDKSMNTGADYIDSQHKQLVRIGRDVEQLILTNCIGVTSQSLLDIVCNLREYASYHFYDEECIMEKAGYPNLKKHRLTHTSVINYILAIDCPRMQKYPLEELQKLSEYLREYLFHHILVEDNEMVKAIGVKRVNELSEELFKTGTF